MGDNEVGKLFIGGVDKDSSAEDFRQLFEKYGILEDCILMKDAESESGRNRGFGFVKYQDPKCSEAVLNVIQLTLNGKKLDAKQCTPRGAPRQPSDMSSSSTSPAGEPDSPQKMFIGGIPQGATESSLTELFTTYGSVDRVQLMTDKVTNNHKGFGFVTFNSPEPVHTLCQQRFLQFEGKTMECKAAESRFRSRTAPTGGYGGQGNYGGGNWQQGGQGDNYGYGSGGNWGGNQQQQQISGVWGQQMTMGSYGAQGGYGGGQNAYGSSGYGGTQNGGSYGAGYGGQSGSYGNQSSGYANQSSGYANQSSGYGTPTSGYGATQSSGYGNQSSGYGGGQSGGYSAQYGQSNAYGGATGGSQGYAGAYGSSTQNDQYGASSGGGSGYNASGSYEGDVSEGSYTSPITVDYAQSSQSSVSGGGGNSGLEGDSGGPTSTNHTQRPSNSVQQFHPYRR